MIKCGEYLIVESKEDLESRKVNGRILIDGGYVEEDINSLAYPCILKYCDSGDLHFCSSWYLAKNPKGAVNGIIDGINREISQLLKLESEIAKVIYDM